MDAKLKGDEMGYCTNYSLSVTNGSEDLIGKLIESCEDARYAIESNGETYDSTKWYESDNDLKRFSKKHPETLFILSGEGEENGDIWKAYFKNGKMHTIKAQIVFDTFDESKLK